MVEKECIVCGREFKCVKRTRQTCSDKCRVIKKRQNAACEICGNIFSTKGYNCKWCSDSCKKLYKKSQEIEKTCEFCGKSYMSNYKTKKYCSRLCGNKARGTINSKQITCSECGKVFTAKSRKSKYCSRPCMIKSCKKKKLTYKCKHCDKTFSPRCTGRVTFCTRDCYYSYVKATAKKPTPKKQINIIDCKLCGKQMKSTYGAVEYCRSCSARRKMDMHKNCNYYRRIAANAHADNSVDKQEIFARDKWKCQLCGIATLKRYDPSTPDRLAKSPTLDHVIPLSKGGSHTRSNTQLLCSKCNTAKGAKVLSLF